jgi:hypothetical protein
LQLLLLCLILCLLPLLPLLLPLLPLLLPLLPLLLPLLLAMQLTVIPELAVPPGGKISSYSTPGSRAIFGSAAAAQQTSSKPLGT